MFNFKAIKISHKNIKMIDDWAYYIIDIFYKYVYIEINKKAWLEKIRIFKIEEL